MLQKSAIQTAVLALLRALMQREAFQNMRLAGGTALALQIGHRKSNDLDFFGTVDFETMDVHEVFAGFSKVISLQRSKNINIFNINGIKVDFVNYSYPWLEEYIMEENIRLAKLPDIAAMKLAATTGRGSRKDFVDIYFLLKKYSLKEMLGFYRKKYFDASEFLVLKSLTYFEDAEKEPPIATKDNIPWEKIKGLILKEVSAFNKTL